MQRLSPGDPSGHDFPPTSHMIGALSGPVPEGIGERLFAILIGALAVAGAVWLDMPRLLWPALVGGLAWSRSIAGGEACTLGRPAAIPGNLPIPVSVVERSGLWQHFATSRGSGPTQLDRKRSDPDLRTACRRADQIKRMTSEVSVVRLCEPHSSFW